MSSASLELDPRPAPSSLAVESADVPRWAASRVALRAVRTGFVAARAAAALRRAEDLRGRTRRLRDACRDILAAHGVDVRVRGRFPPGPALYVANHVSWLDPIALLAEVPCAAVAKGEVARWPVVGALARSAGVLFLRRGCGHSGARVLRGMLRSLAQGVAVLNFPEGTTTEGDDVLEFRAGSFGVARLAGVPVVPVAVRYRSPGMAWTLGASFVPHYVGVAARAGCALDLIACPPLPPEASDLRAAARAREAIRAALREAL